LRIGDHNIAPRVAADRDDLAVGEAPRLQRMSLGRIQKMDGDEIPGG
jgi:hypothetical protein